MSRPLLLLAAVALAGIAAWVFLTPPPEEGPVTPEEPHVEAQASPEAGSLEVGAEESTPEPKSEASGIVRTQVEEAASTEPADGGFLPSLAEGEGIRVEVVQGEEKAPVAGATVLVVDTGRVDEYALESSLAQTRDISAVLDAIAERYRTGSDGSVVVPHVEQMLAVAARTEGMSCFQLPAAPDENDVLVLELKPMRAVQVHVIDEEGEGVAGAPVAVTMQQGSRRQGVLGAETNVQGVAEIASLELLDSVPMRGKIAAGLAMLLDEAIEEEFNLEKPPEGGVVLEKPPTGVLEILLRDREGQPVAAGVRVAAQRVPEGETDEFQRWQRDEQTVITEADGKALFPYVGLGLRLTVEARAPIDGQVWRGAVDGPARAGEVTQLELQPDVSLPMISFLVVDEAGTPQASTTLQARLSEESDSGSNSSSFSVRSDAEGRVHYAFDDAPMVNAKRFLDVTVNDGVDTGRLDLSGTLHPGVNDYGRLVLGTPPMLASGTVLGPDGQPLAGAEIRVARRKYWGPKENDNFYWDTLWRYDARSDGDGKFALQGYCEDIELQVTATRDGMQPAVEECQNGAAGLVLRMQTGAALAGRVLLDKEIDHEQVRVSLSNDEEGASSQTGLGALGNFSWNALTPGIYTLTVQASEGGEEFFSVEGLRLVAGQTNEDSRIAEIDLRGKLKGFTLKFEDEKGKHVGQVTVADVARELRWWTWDGQLKVLTMQAPLDLEVRAEGFRITELSGVQADRTVTLQAGLPVRLTLTSTSAIPQGWELHAWMAPVRTEEHGDGYHVRGVDGRFDERGETLVHAPGPGSFEVSLMLGRAGGNSRWGMGNNQTVEIAELSGEQRVSVDVDADALQRTMQRIIDSEGGS